MNITFNAATILDMVLDHQFNKTQIEQIAMQLHNDLRTGGPLEWLANFPEFTDELENQLQ